MRYFGPYIWSRLDSKAKDKPSLQSFKSSIRRIDLVDLISDNCGSCIICNLFPINLVSPISLCYVGVYLIFASLSPIQFR